MNQPTPRELATAFLTERERRDLLEVGELMRSTFCSSKSGPLQPTVDMRPWGLEVTQYAPDAWAQQVAYHTYCREHGYPTGGRAGWGEAEGYPTLPPLDEQRRSTVRVTWTRLRGWLQEDATGQQLELDLTLA